MQRYSHTQIGWFITFALLTVGAVACAAMAYIQTEASMPIAAIACVLALLLIALFGWLHVSVDSEEVIARFGVGLIRRKIPLSRVVRATAVRNRWWYGYGIRLTPHGWLFNLQGLDAIELEFTNGKKFRIGTDEPEQLLGALRKHLPSGERSTQLER